MKATLDGRFFEKGRKVTKADMESLRIAPARFHGEWNYVIRPHEK